MPSLLSASTLAEAIRGCAAAWPDRPVVFPELTADFTIGQLHHAAGHFAGVLIRAGVGHGDVVGLLSSTGPQVLVGVFGITAAGAAVSVLPNPPIMHDLQSSAQQLMGFLDAADMRYLLVDKAMQEIAEIIRAARPHVTVLELPAIDASGASIPEPAMHLPELQSHDVAIIQYTSGSTTRPRGVVLRHSTVLAGLRSIGASARITCDDVYIQWVPHFHDMGLFGWLAYLLHGATTHTFSPLSFIRHPARFLSYFAEHRGTVSAGPDFGYELMLAAVNEQSAAELDLSRWKLAFNGAEPVSAATVRAFARKLAPAGVRSETMFPVYGLAEATLAVTFPVPGEAPEILHIDRRLLTNGNKVHVAQATDPDAKAVVSVGRPIEGMDLRLVGTSGNPVTAGVLAEIQIRGLAVTDGYYRDRQASDTLFDGEWLRTGDLGFQYDGRLYVAGRIKDMIIVRGENFFAQDVEAVVSCIPGVYRRRCVAVPDEAEYLTVVAETKGEHEPLAEQIRVCVAAALGLSAIRVHIVRPGVLPRTTSGKWQRNQVRELVGAAS